VGATPEAAADRVETGLRKTLVNSTALFGGETVSRLCGWLMAFIVARRFGAAGLGQYAYAVAVTSILLMVPDFGLHLAAIRDLSAKPKQLRTTFWTLHWIKLPLTGALVSGVLVFGAAALRDQGRRTLLYVLLARAVLMTFSQAYMAIFKAFERMHYIGLLQSVNAAVVLIAVVAALRLRASLTLTVSCLLAGQAAETCLGWYTARKRFATEEVYGWNPALVRTLLLTAAPIGVTVILQALNLRLDLLILSVFASNAELGQLQAANSFLLATFLGTSLSLGVIFPRICRLMSEGREEGCIYVGNLLKHGTLLLAALSLAVWLEAPKLLRLLYGGELAGAANLLRLVAPALPLMFINTLLVYVFFAARLRSVYLGTLGLSVGLTAALCFWLVPKYGASGAAVADLIRESAVAAVFLAQLRRRGLAAGAAPALLKVCPCLAILTLLLVAFAPTLGPVPLWTAACTVLLLGATLLLAGLPRRAEILVMLGGHP
jgi:O-antigen/teichoic acid export membrane protein